MIKYPKILVRGINFLGQCGLGNKINYTENDSFIELKLQDIKTSSIISNNGSNILMLSDKKTLLYFGFNWDLRSYYRISIFYQKFPKAMTLLKFIWPTFSSFPYTPCVLNTFQDEIKQYDLGGSFCIVLDNKGKVYGVGENSWNQISPKNDISIFKFVNIEIGEGITVDKISCGFQHSLFLTSNGDIYGCGKCSRGQLGSLNENKENLVSPQKLNISNKNINGKIIDISTGKYHSLFLTDKGKVYGVGNNKFGQLGLNPKTNDFSNELVEIEFDEDVFISKIVCGDNHSLFLTNDGRLYGNGDNTQGQINGVLEDLYYKSTPVEIQFKEKILDVKAKNLRSCALLEGGKAVYWGGYYFVKGYSFSNLPKIEGFNYYNNEKGLENSYIKDVGLGLLHDCVVIDNI